ncbi:MAG TPA: 50S ribosomal protein L10 [Thioploca sp.]|nr:MAG: 50S ribosomal protein L10 [Gammaproteobacteria bacterium]HDN25994.1 50S ribosomal protein L10 [Thioploca sp.]
MPLKLEDKRAIVATVHKIASTAHSAIAAEYRGMTVTQMTQLRVQARQADVYLRVVRNTLARRAVLNTDFECLRDILVGPVVLAFSIDDPGAAARVIRDFSKNNDKLVVKGVAIGGQLLGASEIDIVAKLPTLKQAISKLMSVIQAPITKLVCTIQEPYAKLVRTIAAVRDSKSNH